MRSVAETVQLDLSLRQSRTIYRTLAILFFLGAIAGVFWVWAGVSALWQSIAQGYFPAGTLGPAIRITVGGVFIGVEYVCIAQSMEATRRLNLLLEDPSKTVRKMPAPFQTSLFGPYH